MKRCREHGGYFFGVKARYHGIFYVGASVGVQEGDAGAHRELGFGEVERELADVLYSEGGRELAVI